MFDAMFRGLFDTDMATVIRVAYFLLCVCCSLLLGLVLAWAHTYRAR